MSKITKMLLIGIVCIGAFLRLYHVQDIPPGVNRDEASIGFTAYSLLKTGNDEYGKFLPLSFQSFGDWKLPVYIYATIPFVGILGMTELAVRLPSALAGITTVALVYFLVHELLEKQRYKNSLALLAATVLAIAPWHIHLSRVESESNVAAMCITLGTILFLRALNNKPKLLPFAASLFALTFYTYHGNHVFTTLYVAGLLWIYIDKILQVSSWKISGVVFLCMVGIILSATLHQADNTKISGISIFGDPTVIHTNIELPRTEHASADSVSATLFHNRFLYAATTVWNNYIKAFSPEFLFIHGGGNHAHNIENFGNMYPIEALFVFLGIFALLALRKERSHKLLLWWLAVSPVAASITKDAPHTNRMFAVFPALSILVAYGILTLVTEWKSKTVRVACIVGICLLYAVSLGIYADRYYVHFPRNEAGNWGYAYKYITQIVNTPKNKSKQIIFSHPEYSPYIFLVFYGGYDPALYQKESVRYSLTPDAFAHVASFGRFSFRAINWGTDMNKPNTILIDVENEIPQTIKDSSKYIGPVILPDGTKPWALVDTSL